MVTYLPISSPFIRFAGRYVDDAFGVAAGYNFFIFEAAMVPFEITACNIIITYWSDAVPVAAIIVIILVLFVCVMPSTGVSSVASGNPGAVLTTSLLGSSTSSLCSGMVKQNSGWPSGKSFSVWG